MNRIIPFSSAVFDLDKLWIIVFFYLKKNGD